VCLLGGGGLIADWCPSGRKQLGRAAGHELQLKGEQEASLLGAAAKLERVNPTPGKHQAPLASLSITAITITINIINTDIIAFDIII